MARMVKEEEYAAKRKEILDVARQLVFTKGYEQMSIQDICDALEISKGAFYHYFDSKPALLDGLLDVLISEGEAWLTPIATDPKLGAIEKFRRYFAEAGRWKTTQKEFLLALLRVWYADDNAIVRQKQQTLAIDHVVPFLATIIRQGVEEGVFTVRHPEQTAQVILALVASVGDAWAVLLLAPEPAPDAEQRIMDSLAAYSEAVERALGAPPGSLPLMDDEILRQWLPSARVAAAVKVGTVSGER
jgi:AcrR family transcriptional regulator